MNHKKAFIHHSKDFFCWFIIESGGRVLSMCEHHYGEMDSPALAEHMAKQALDEGLAFAKSNHGYDVDFSKDGLSRWLDIFGIPPKPDWRPTESIAEDYYAI